jgi:hypothetical protein
MLESSLAAKHNVTPEDANDAFGYRDISGAKTYAAAQPMQVRLGTLAFAAPTIVIPGGISDKVGGSIVMGCWKIIASRSTIRFTR